MDELSVRVIPFSKEQGRFDKNRVHTWQEWHSFRNDVLDILSRYGTVGPLGKLPILETFEESTNEWYVTTRKPDFFVVDDDMYGNSVRVEASSALVKPPLLDELLMLVLPTNDWSVYLALIKGGLWVFRDQVFFEGIFFADCGSVADLYHRCAIGSDSQGRNC
jgi:hypothetical protein